MAVKMIQTQAAKAAAESVAAQMQPGYEAQGYALAQTVIAEQIGQGNAWLRYVARLYDLSDKARECFVSELDKHTRDMGAHVKAKEGTDEHDLYRKANASAKVQLSNLRKIAKAFMLGWTPAVKLTETGKVSRKGDMVELADPFYTIVAQARIVVGSAAAGRPRKSFAEKFAKLLEAEKPSEEELRAVVKVIEEALAA